jgi:hypothetical protein
MEKRMENKLIMLRAVLKLMELNQSLWQNNAAIVAAYNELCDLVDQINAYLKSVNNGNSGLAASKQNLQNALIEQAFELASVLLAFANRTNNAVLRSKIDFPISHLKGMRESELGTECQGILELVRNNQQAMTESGIANEKIDSFDELTNQYMQELPNHRLSVSQSKAINEKIKTLMTQALALTSGQLDRLMISLKSAQPDFYASYLNARKVVDYGIRYEKPDDDTTPDEPAK